MKKLSDMSLEELWQLFPIILKTHNPDYAMWYKEEKTHILQLLRDYDVCRINHIGSTAVEGLIAKPIVDILLELPLNYDMSDITHLLQENGWILMQQYEEQGMLKLNKGYTQTGFAEKVFHLHIKPLGDWGELYFRDYLRAYPAVARQYERLKQRLLEQFEHNRDAYTNAKSEFVIEHTKKAQLEYGTRYLPSEHQ